MTALKARHLTKRCSQCARDRSPSEFFRATRNPDGLQSWCKSCAGEYRRKRMSEPGAKARDAERSRAWAAAHHAGRIAYGRARYAARRDEYRAKEKARGPARAAWHRARSYGLSPADYDELLATQRGLCAICGQADVSKTLHVDHDHKTGRIRGLLCGRCNRAIGLLLDDPDLLLAAAAYLAQP